jgi:hypothetical protein
MLTSGSRWRISRARPTSSACVTATDIGSTAPAARSAPTAASIVAPVLSMSSTISGSRPRTSPIDGVRFHGLAVQACLVDERHRHVKLVRVRPCQLDGSKIWCDDGRLFADHPFNGPRQ